MSEAALIKLLASRLTPRMLSGLLKRLAPPEKVTTEIDVECSPLRVSQAQAMFTVRLVNRSEIDVTFDRMTVDVSVEYEPIARFLYLEREELRTRAEATLTLTTMLGVEQRAALQADKAPKYHVRAQFDSPVGRLLVVRTL